MESDVKNHSLIRTWTAVTSLSRQCHWTILMVSDTESLIQLNCKQLLMLNLGMFFASELLFYSCQFICFLCKPMHIHSEFKATEFNNIYSPVGALRNVILNGY